MFANCNSLTNVMIPDSAIIIEYGAFGGDTDLGSITIPASVIAIGQFAFAYCYGLTNVFFQGNAPSADDTVFTGDNYVQAYYVPGTIGWGSILSGISTTQLFLPNPLILNTSMNSGVRDNKFGFVISWATNISLVVEACTNLFNPVWQPIQTNTLTNGSSYFSDSQWTNYPGRFYRLSNIPAKVPYQSTGMVLIRMGSFTMGDPWDGETDAMPTVNVYVSSFYMDTNLVSFNQWQTIYNWAIHSNYAFDTLAYNKGSNYPVTQVDWYDAVKWCNARSWLG